MITLLLIAAALTATHTIIRLVRAVLRLLASIVASAFALGFVLLVLVDLASHGKLP
jgi:hypothetical protein